MPIDSRTTYKVWHYLIHDEALSRAVFDGSYRTIATERGYTADEIEVLDWFAAQPGMRWNVENLRFRAAFETAASLYVHMPRTVHLLTKGDDDWMQDVCYEYLSFYQWDALGHRRLTECERFGRYIRERIMRRRITPQHLDSVLELELAIVDVLKRTIDIPRDGWPAPPQLDGDGLAAATVRRGPAQRLLQQAIDLRGFMTAKPAEQVDAGPGPVTWLIHLASPAHKPRTKVIGDGPKALLERCDGTRTSAQIARAMADEFGLPPDQVTRLIGTFLRDGVLVV